MTAPEPTGPDRPNESPFERIVDDYAPRQDALEWAVEQLAAGQAFDQVELTLREQGLDAEGAESIIEEARQLTRGHRGAVTRDQVMRATNRHYRRGMRLGWMSGMPTLASLWRLIHSIATMRVLRRKQKSSRENER